MYSSHVTTEFKNLPYEAQIERLEAVAHRAIGYYGLEDAPYTLVNYSNNAVFRVDAQAGTFTLRIHRAGQKSAEALHAELRWLERLASNGLRVPSPTGDIYTTTLADESFPVHCTLTTWLAGEHLTVAEMTDDPIQKIGRFIAHLHTITASIAPSADLMRPRLDYEGLFGENSPYNPKDGAKIFTDPQRDIMTQVQMRVLAVFEKLGETPETFGLIHADLIPQNLVWHEGTVGAIDFDDCGYGYYLYDLAPLLWMCRNEPNYAHLRLMLWEGYNQVRPQPVAWQQMLPTLVAARHVASCRWIAGNLSNPSVRARAEVTVAERVEEMKSFLMQPNDL